MSDPTVQSHPPPVWPSTRAASGRGAVLDVIGLVAVLALLGASVVLFAHPWRTASALSSGVQRYSPARDGLSVLSEVRDANHKLVRYESVNARNVAPANVFLVLPTSIRAAVTVAVGESLADARSGKVDPSGATKVGLSDLDKATVIDARTVQLAADGTPSKSSTVTVAAKSGLFQAGLVLDDDTTLAITPPLLLLPTDVSATTAPWHSEGLIGNAPYTADTRVTGVSSESTAVGSFADCLTVVDTLTFGTAPQATVTETAAVYCAGFGLVRRTDDTTKPDGTKAHEESNVVSSNARNVPAASGPPPLSTMPIDQAALGDPASWAATRFARSIPTGISAGATGTPVFVATDPPQVLETDELGDVTSFNAQTGAEVWRFHLAGPALGLIAYDPPTHTVLIGSSDRHVYALDEHGAFRWSFETNDNVSSRPVVINGVVVVGSEDSNVYGLDVATGAKKWVRATAAAIASSPAVAQGVVAIGDDEGNLLGLDPATGALRWSTGLPGSAEGPVTTDGSTFFVGSAGPNTFGAVTAIDATSGNQLWSSPAFNPVRTEVQPGASLVFAIDTGNILAAYDKTTGALRWSTHSLYVGPPIADGDRSIALRNDGRVDVFDGNGAVTNTLSTRDAQSPVDRPPDHAYGMSKGGGALWAADSNGVLFRIGSPGDTTPRLRVKWADGFSVGTNGIPSGQLEIAPAVRDADVVLVDPFGDFSTVDPATGAGHPVGTVDVGTDFIRAEPAVVGDRLVTVVGSNLVATDVRTGAHAWTVKGDGIAVAPLLVSHGLLIFTEVSATPDPVTGSNPGTIRVIDPASGSIVWQAATSGSAGSTPAVVGDIVVASTPPTAFDVRTGAVRWTASSVKGSLFGAIGIDPAANAVIVPMLTDPNTVALVSLDAGTGAVRWSHDLPAGESPSLNARLLVDGGVVVLSTASNHVLGFDASTGAARWTYQPPGPLFGSVEVAGGVVYLVAGRAVVVAVDVRTGKERARSSDLDISVAAQGLTFVHPVATHGVVVFPMVTFVLAVEQLK